jgi:hypothetical protein
MTVAGDEFGATAIRNRCQRATRHMERIVSFKDIPRPFQALGAQWSGLAPDGSPLIMRDVGNREIYALDVQWP